MNTSEPEKLKEEDFH